MEIPEIKTLLKLPEVLRHYNLKPDKSHRLHCPFHADKTPSMQVYYKTGTCYCFSANCKTHGKSLDVIDFIMHKENITKAEAINKAKEMVTGKKEEREKKKENGAEDKGQGTKENQAGEFIKSAVLLKMFTYFKNAVHNSKPARDYIEKRGLDYNKLEIGYNTGQFHHGERKEEALIKSCLAVGLLHPFGSNSRTGGQAYQPFAKYSIVFALKNQSNQTTGLYFRSIINKEGGPLSSPLKQGGKHFYLKDRSGLYPSYPNPGTEKLILTESIIDCASLLQNPEIIKEYGLLAAYGTNGLTEEHKTAIKELKHLKEIIFAFDNDEAGKSAANKYASEFKAAYPNLLITALELPCKDVNETLLAHEPGIFPHLLEKRVNVFSEKTKDERQGTREKENKKEEKEENKNELDTSNPFKLLFQTETAIYAAQGGLSKFTDSLKITLVIESKTTWQKSRNKIDLYEDKQIEKLSKEVSERLQLNKEKLEADIYRFTDLLETYREKELLKNETKEESQSTIYLTIKEREELVAFGKKPKLIQRLNDLLGKAGIVGEEKNRIFLLIIAASYKMPETLHALIQGSSGSGKTRLLKQISDCIPKEKVTRLTRVSDRVLYNYSENYFTNRLFCLEDMDSLSEEAQLAFRELQSSGQLRSAASIKQESGEMKAGEKIVSGPIASLCCTTKGEIYEDNMGRCFLIAVDESSGQTRKIIEYQNKKAAGENDPGEEEKIKTFIQSYIRELKPLQVVNPYAGKIHLPEEAHKIRRLNELFQGFVKIITVLNQYQRKKDAKGRLVAEIEDLGTAIEIIFESIVLKVDELDGSLRQFYEQLKNYIEKKNKSQSFTRFEVREATGLGKSQQHHYLSQLIALEYIRQFGFANRGFSYKIAYWDNYSTLRERIRKAMQNQLDALSTGSRPDTSRKPEQ